MILRNNTRDKYTVISQNILKDKRLNIKDRGMICTLLSLPDNWDFSIAGLCAILPDGSRTIRESLRRLEKYGYLKRERIHNKYGMFDDVVWEIIENPTTQPDVQNAHVDNAHVDNAHVENSIQSNTNISNTKLSNNPSNLIYTEDEKRWTINDLIYNMGIKYHELDDNEKNVCDIFLEVLNSNQEYFRIGGAKIAFKDVYNRLLRINREDIKIISERITESVKPIKNLKSYIIKSLYNEPTTRDLYWANRVSVDFSNK